MTTSPKNMEIVQPFEPTMIRYKFGIGADHVKDGKLEKGDIAREQRTQINHVNALKMEQIFGINLNMVTCISAQRLLFAVCVGLYHLPL